MKASRRPEDPRDPTGTAQSRPKATGLGVLGRKWTILILRDMAVMRVERFNQLLKATPGLTPRILSKRLRQLEREGMIERVEERKGPNLVRWRLTEKGSDTIPILMGFAAFGSKWNAEEVSEDEVKLGELPRVGGTEHRETTPRASSSGGFLGPARQFER
jgi:DNA-binding HxlR family transcriptional regulator